MLKKIYTKKIPGMWAWTWYAHDEELFIMGTNEWITLAASTTAVNYNYIFKIAHFKNQMDPQIGGPHFMQATQE